jgi:hypothetical protein
MQLVEGWQLSRALQGRMRRDGATVELTLSGIEKVETQNIRRTRRTWVGEALESPLLTSDTRKRLLKTPRKLSVCSSDI